MKIPYLDLFLSAVKLDSMLGANSRKTQVTVICEELYPQCSDFSMRCQLGLCSWCMETSKLYSGDTYFIALILSLFSGQLPLVYYWLSTIESDVANNR